MSDVVVSVVESTTTVTVTDQDVAVAITETPVVITTGTSGPQGIKGDTGPATTLSVGTVSKSSDDTATVTITGDAPDQTISFVYRVACKAFKELREFKVKLVLPERLVQPAQLALKGKG
jgi:hypothetical protein